MVYWQNPLLPQYPTAQPPPESILGFILLCVTQGLVLVLPEVSVLPSKVEIKSLISRAQWAQKRARQRLPEASREETGIPGSLESQGYEGHTSKQKLLKVETHLSRILSQLLLFYSQQQEEKAIRVASRSVPSLLPGPAECQPSLVDVQEHP